MKRNIFRVLLIIQCVHASSCNSSPAESPPHHIIADIAIAVDNRTETTRSIVLEANAHEYSLGSVGANETKLFSVPSAAGQAIAGLRLKASRRAGDTYQSALFRLSPGDRFVWVVTPKR